MILWQSNLYCGFIDQPLGNMGPNLWGVNDRAQILQTQNYQQHPSCFWISHPTKHGQWNGPGTMCSPGASPRNRRKPITGRTDRPTDAPTDRRTSHVMTIPLMPIWLRDKKPYGERWLLANQKLLPQSYQWQRWIETSEWLLWILIWRGLIFILIIFLREKFQRKIVVWSSCMDHPTSR
jgi:hypothetical protein